MKTTRKRAEALAFQICWLVKETLGNVIASGETDESDKKYYDMADEYLKWYCNKTISQPPKQY